MDHRAEIDGLRALAIMAVVVYHAFPYLMPGGFIGVDIFFVISGFLITQILIKEFTEEKFTYAGFYLRRARRLLPALTLVLVSVVIAGWFFLWPDEYVSLSKHLLAGVFFLTNLSLLKEAGYFDTMAETKPLLHLWSLGVEAQYYLVWPAIVAFAIRRRCVLSVFAAITLCSFVLGVLLLFIYPDAVFYLPLTRFWELAAGGWLAQFMKTSGAPSFQERQADMAVLTGLLALFFAMFFLSPGMSFSGWSGLLLPVSASMLVLWVGGKGSLGRHVLANPIAIYLGKISYPLYLWHWPIFSLVIILSNRRPETSVMLVLCLISLILAHLTWSGIEWPISRRLNNRAMKHILALFFLVAFASGVAWQMKGFPGRFSGGKDKYFHIDMLSISKDGWSSKCPEGLTVDAETSCLSSKNREGKKGILLFGDSHAMAFAPGLVEVIDHENPLLFLEAFSKGGGCMPFPGIEKLGNHRRCQPFFSEIVQYALNEAYGDDVVIMARWASALSGEGFGVDRSAMRRKFHDIRNEQGDALPMSLLFENGLAETLRLLKDAGKRVILIHQVPELGFDPVQCKPRPYAFFDASTQCAVSRKDVDLRQNAYREIVSKVLVNFPEVETFDPLNYLCDDEWCRARLEGEGMAYRDDDHLSQVGAHFLAMVFIDRFFHER